MNTKTEFSYNTLTQKDQQIYLLTADLMCERLSGRAVRRTITQNAFDLYLDAAAGKTITSENIDTITGNDILILADSESSFTKIVFVKVVEFKVTAGVGQLRWADGEEVKGSPVIDLNNPTEAFDRDTVAVDNFMLLNNK